MSVYKPKNSPFYQFDFQLSGRRFHGTTGTANRRKAEKIEADERTKAEEVIRKDKAAAKVGRKGGPLTIDTAANRYYDEVGKNHANAETTDTDLERLVGYFGPTKLLDDISDDDVAELVRWRSAQHLWGKPEKADGSTMPLVTPSTVNRSTTLVLKKLFTRAKRTWKYHFSNEPDWTGHFLDEPKERIRELHSHEGSALELATRSDYQPIFDFARATGLRLDECLIEWTMVNWESGWIIRTGKNGQLVKTGITSVVRDIIEPLIGHHHKFVFTYQAQRARKAESSYKGDGKARIRGKRYPVTYNGLKSQWKIIRENAGVEDFRFHDFRHDVGTKLLRASGNLKKVQKALNHRDIKTTARYAHVLDEEVAEDMEALQLKMRERSAESRTKSRTRK